MSRKRKSDPIPPAETPTAVAEPPVVEPPVAEPKVDGQSFADKVGKKQWVPAPDPFPVATDKVAGVRLFQSIRDRQMAIMFGDGSPESKPSQAVIDRMKEARFTWKSKDRIWAHSFTPESFSRTHIDAERLYQEVRQMIREEKGIEATPDMPF